MTDSRSFFVDSRGEVSTPATTAPVLGFVERVCSQCGVEWLMTQSECRCGSHELTERFHEPDLLERGPFGAIRRLVIPGKKAPPRATAELVGDLRALQITLTQLLDDLRRTDAALIASVRGGVEELAPAQGYVHRSLATTGDRAPQCIDGLGLGLESLADYLGAAVTNLEDSK